jgi:ribosomal subunit interface protein
MRIQTVTRQCEVPASILTRADRRFRRLRRLDPQLSSAEVIFREEKHRKRVEGILSLDGEATAVAQAEEHSFQAALDVVTGRLEKILRRRRDHLRSHKSPRLADVVAELAPQAILPAEEEDHD